MYQPGRVEARYRLLPHTGKFDEAKEHRFGLESKSTPLFQQLGEPAASQTLPARASLLTLPDKPVLTLYIKASDGAMLVRLLNASDVEQAATIKSNLLRINEAALCDALEQPLSELEVQGGNVFINIPPRRVVTVKLKV